ncbi:protein kinase domain-containing protein [Nocardia sp. NPDC003693]
MSLAPGAVFAGFTIERLLGAGGMGAVYLAEHPRLERRVALKVLATTFTADAKARSAFTREANLAAGLDHPNIVPVYDRSELDDPALWLAMRHIDGGDAAALLEPHPHGLAPARAVRLITDAAHALDYAHARGVLHRDVKPANLLIEHNRRHGERAVLTDFGIARTLDDTVTLSGIAATFAYAAPERFGDTPADHRADIYSLGCTLFQLLTGRQPFARKDQAAVIGAHLTAPPPSPREVRPDLPADLDVVIATALAKSPDSRYPTCAALAEAAARALPPLAPTERAAHSRSPVAPETPAHSSSATTEFDRRTAEPRDTGGARADEAPRVTDASRAADTDRASTAGAAAAVHDDSNPLEDSASRAADTDGDAAAHGDRNPLEDSAFRDEAAIPTVISSPAPRVAPVPTPVDLRKPANPRVDQPAADATDLPAAQPNSDEPRILPAPSAAEILDSPAPARPKRRAVIASGVLLTAITATIGITLAIRGGSESPTTTAPSTTTTTAPITTTTAPSTTAPPSPVETTTAPPAEAPPETEPYIAPAPPVQQVVPTYTAPRPQSPATQAPAIVPQTRVHQWPG